MTQSPSGTRLTDYPQPSVTVDVLIFTIRDNQLQIALIQRGIEPFKGMWAIPGGFVRIKEDLVSAARREIEEETGVTDVFLEQLAAYGDLDRDPRGRVVTVAYYALVPSERLSLRAATDAADASWFPVHEVPQLAFDHARILSDALGRVKQKLENSNVAFALLPPHFRLSELQRVYEIILGKELDKRNFRKKILSLGLIQPTDKYASGAHRPAQLFCWAEQKSVAFD